MASFWGVSFLYHGKTKIIQKVDLSIQQMAAWSTVFMDEQKVVRNAKWLDDDVTKRPIALMSAIGKGF